jgi:hypothetical protein
MKLRAHSSQRRASRIVAVGVLGEMAVLAGRPALAPVGVLARVCHPDLPATSRRLPGEDVDDPGRPRDQRGPESDPGPAFPIYVPKVQGLRTRRRIIVVRSLRNLPARSDIRHSRHHLVHV